MRPEERGVEDGGRREGCSSRGLNGKVSFFFLGGGGGGLG